jgi:hypothetical protein
VIASILATISPILSPIADIFPPVTNVLTTVPLVLATIADILEPIATPTIVQRITSIFTTIANILAMIPHILPTIAHVFAAVPNVFAPVAPVLEAVAHNRTVSTRGRVDGLRTQDGRCSNHQGRGDRSHSEIAHCCPSRDGIGARRHDVRLLVRRLRFLNVKAARAATFASRAAHTPGPTGVIPRHEAR